jgi:serine/threonine-protein kinase
MQYVRGRGLRSAMGEPIPWPRAVEVGQEIADALATAHAERIVHRDLKPENVVLEPRGDGTERVKVLDFGVARVVEETAAAPAKQLTRVGTVIGTPGYMAPEQALGELVDGRADLYALGVILWELVTGRTLFPEDDLTAILTRQLTTEIPRASTVVADLPPELDALIASLLHKARDQRPERASEVRDLLSRLALSARISRATSSGEIRVPDPSGAFAHASISQSLPAVRVSGLASAPTMHASSSAHAAPSLGRAMSPNPIAGAALSLPGPRLAIPGIGDVPALLAGLGCAVPVGLFAMIAILWIALGSSDPPPTTTTTPPPIADAPIATPPPVAELEPNTPRERDREREAQARAEAEARAEVVPSDTGAERALPPIPATIAEDVEVILSGSDARARARVAEQLDTLAPADAPAFVHAVVDLELAESCRDRREVIQTIERIQDPRALPALERIDELPRSGCGFLNTQDCWRCLRRDLSRTMRALRSGGAVE